ncbi:MAG: peptidoglycan-binding protein [Clostridium perfringens]|nr:peptidoglycan-binding protein [Clostridium perfringens]
MATGSLKIQCFSENTYIPVNKAKIIVTPTDGNGAATRENVEIYTNSSGLAEIIDLDAPPIENSYTPGLIPYSFVDITVEKDGYNTVVIKGIQIYPERIAFQRINFRATSQSSRQETIISIPANVQVGNYPPKIPEAEEKPLPKPQGTVVLPEPVVPQYIRVHAGNPNDNSVPNYTVPYNEYIENVASCEIYSTWPNSTIRANIYSIISFTLNRIYTEWYRGQGKNFDITSSTAYDQAFSYGRNIYENIAQIVDEIFSTYIQRQNAKQPLLSQFCNGTTVTCNGLSQWGSKYLGDQGDTPYEILTYYYGDNINLVTAPKVLGIPESYPGYTLSLGSSGSPVRTIQSQLNTISKSFPLIPKLAVDGIYGSATENSVKVFQQTFGLPVTGVVDYATWYKISAIFVGVTKIAELRGDEGNLRKIFTPPIISAYEEEVPKVYYYI